jgi:hypothetical protein
VRVGAAPSFAASCTWEMPGIHRLFSASNSQNSQRCFHSRVMLFYLVVYLLLLFLFVFIFNTNLALSPVVKIIIILCATKKINVKYHTLTIVSLIW